MPSGDSIKENDVGKITKTTLFEKVMGSINPFSQYVIRELKDQSNAKLWELEESIFKKPSGEVKRESLIRSSSEMFVIYKYTNDPFMQCKSDRYTQGKFVPFRDLFPDEESHIFETSILQQLKI